MLYPMEKVISCQRLINYYTSQCDNPNLVQFVILEVDMRRRLNEKNLKVNLNQKNSKIFKE